MSPLRLTFPGLVWLLLVGWLGMLPVAAAERVDVTLEECQAFVAGKQGILLDARGAKHFVRGHITGAVNLPVNDFEKNYQKLQARLEADKNQRIVVYCSSVNCPDSDRLRGKLEKLGYTRVDVFRRGAAAWWKAGLPMETAQEEPRR